MPSFTSSMPAGQPISNSPNLFSANHPVYTVTCESRTGHAPGRRSARAPISGLPRESWNVSTRAAGPERRDIPVGDGFSALDRANTIETGLGDHQARTACSPAAASRSGGATMAGREMWRRYVDGRLRALSGRRKGGPTTILSTVWGGRGYAVARGGSFTRFRDLARTRRAPRGSTPRPIIRDRLPAWWRNLGMDGKGASCPPACRGRVCKPPRWIRPCWRGGGGGAPSGAGGLRGRSRRTRAAGVAARAGAGRPRILVQMRVGEPGTPGSNQRTGTAIFALIPYTTLLLLM